MWNVKPTDLWNWDALKTKIAKYGVRNSLLIAQMSDTFMAQILKNNESVEPYTSNIYTIHALSRQFSIVKPFLLRDLIQRDLWDEDMCNKIIMNGGSIQVNIIYFNYFLTLFVTCLDDRCSKGNKQMLKKISIK